MHGIILLTRGIIIRHGTGEDGILHTLTTHTGTGAIHITLHGIGDTITVTPTHITTGLATIGISIRDIITTLGITIQDIIDLDIMYLMAPQKILVTGITERGIHPEEGILTGQQPVRAVTVQI